MMRYSRLHTYLLFLLILFLLISNSAMAEESWIDRLQEKSQFAGFKSEDYHKCGFPLVLEAMMSEDVSRQAIVSQHHLELMQQTYDTYLSPSGHFLIHYETSGFDAIPDYDRNENGTPDYLEFVAKSFDRAWEIEIDSLGFDPPPDQNGNPVQTYSVFCSRLNQYGITFWNSGDDLPDPGFNYPSRIEISTNYAFVPDTLYAHITNDPIVKDSLAIAVTAAHEFNHAIQLGYRIWFDNNNPNGPVSDLWFIENSAVYMEEVVAEEVDDYYQYLPSFFNHTDKHIAITFPELRIFGEVVLDIMLGQLYGKTITRE
ncbi:hypothetical protein GWN26_10615, partial [Candidatus Saccharibacteria bacterium]|nr:hypothetical protein [Calditrichia bacterium]NIV99548.1 hypothetical protein [Candidatus Saccharibacteria bacterium]NIW79840.1 hypothetical protein [Calditrichia bacterium]